MSIVTRLLSGLLVVSCLAGAGYWQPGWAALGLGWRAEPEGQALEQQRQRRKQLDQRGAVVGQRLKAKRAVVVQLLERELTLFEAAAWFGYFNDNPPECRDDYRDIIPGRSDEEKLCRQVIGWAEAECRTRISASRAEELTRELEGALRRHTEEHGRVVLPEL